MSKLSAWMRKYERPFQVAVKSGRGSVRVQFYDGYVTVVGIQPGLGHFRQEIKIPRSAWIQLLKQLPAPTRLMEGPDFDAHRAERVYYRQEQEQLQDLRQEKRSRRLEEEKANRYARAKRRAARRRRLEDATD